MLPQAPGRSLTGLEAVTVQTSSAQSTSAVDCHGVELDTDAPGTLKASWIWTHMGAQQVSATLCLIKLPVRGWGVTCHACESAACVSHACVRAARRCVVMRACIAADHRLDIMQLGVIY